MAGAHGARHAHAHGHGPATPSGWGIRIFLAIVLVPLFAAIGLGAFLLRPTGAAHPVPSYFLGPDGKAVTLTNATVDSVRRGPCGRPVAGAPAPTGSLAVACLDLDVTLTSGPEKGMATSIQQAYDPSLPTIKAGDKVRLSGATDLAGRPSFTFADFQRSRPLAIVAALFALVVILVARWRGLAALAGVVLTFGMLRYFLLPALLDGRSPVGVAIVGSAGLLFVLLYLAHGLSARTSVALIGTLASLALTGGLAAAAISMTHLTGLGSDDNYTLKAFSGELSLTGLLLAGLIIGSLGLLNDVTVTQASAVWELSDARTDAGPWDLYRSAMRIGRDHIASSVYTIVLAYAGAALPSLLLFTLAARPGYDVLTGDLIGQEIVRTAIGGIGLVASVPVTTALAALIAARRG